MFLYFYRGLEIPSSLLGEAESLLNKLETIVNDLKRDTSSWFDSGAARELLHPDSPLGKKIRQVEEKIKEARDALAKGDIASAKESLDSLLDALLALSKEKKSMQEKENLKIIASFLEKDVPQAGNELLYLLEKFENEIKKQKAEEGTTTTPPDSKKNYIDVPSVFFTLPAPKKTENNQVEKEETKVVREIREFKTVPIRNQLPKCYNDSSNPNEKSIQDLSKNPENLQKLENYNFDNIEISLQGTKLNIVCGDIDPALILDPNDFADFLRFYYLTCNRLIGDSLPTNLWWEVFDSGELKEPDLLRQLLFSMGAVAAGGDDPYPAQQFNREFSEIKKKFEDYSFLLHKKISYTYSLLNAQRKILYDERKKLEKEREDIYREYSQFEGYEDLVSKRKNNELSADEKKRLDKMEKNSKINKFISKLNENTKKINMISDKIKKIDKDLDALEEMHKTTLKLYEQFIVRVKKVNEKVIEFNDFVEKLVKYNDAYCAMRTNFNSGNIVDYFENRFNPSSKEDMDCLQFLIKRLILAELYLRDNDFPSLDVTLDKSLFYNPNSHTNYNIERKAPISKYENLSMLYYALSSSKNNPLKNLIKNEKDMPSLISTILEDKAGFSSGTPYQALYLGINEKYVELAADALRGDSWWKLHPLLFPPFGSQPFCSLPFSTIFPIPKDKTWVNPDKTKYPDLLDYAVDFVDMFISRLFYPSDPSSYGSYNKQNNDLIPTIPTIRTAREPFLTDWQKRFNFLFNLILAGIPEALSMRAHAYEEAILNPTLNNLARLEEVKGYTNLSIGMSVPLLLLSTVSFANKILSSTPRIARFTIYGKQYAWEVFGLKNPSWELWFVGSEEAGARSILFGTQKSAWGLFFSKHPPGWGGTGLDLVSTFPSHPPPLLTLTSHTSTYLPSTLFPSTYLPSTLFSPTLFTDPFFTYLYPKSFFPLLTTRNTSIQLTEHIPTPPPTESPRPKYFNSGGTVPIRNGIPEDQPPSYYIEIQFKALQEMHKIVPKFFAEPYELVLDGEGNPIGYYMEKFDESSRLDIYLQNGGKLMPDFESELRGAIDAINSEGLVHGDLKINNIFVVLNEKGEMTGFKIIDPVGFPVNSGDKNLDIIGIQKIMENVNEIQISSLPEELIPDAINLMQEKALKEGVPLDDLIQIRSKFTDNRRENMKLFAKHLSNKKVAIPTKQEVLDYRQSLQRKIEKDLNGYRSSDGTFEWLYSAEDPVDKLLNLARENPQIQTVLLMTRSLTPARPLTLGEALSIRNAATELPVGREDVLRLFMDRKQRPALFERVISDVSSSNPTKKVEEYRQTIQFIKDYIDQFPSNISEFYAKAVSFAEQQGLSIQALQIRQCTVQYGITPDNFAGVKAHLCVASDNKFYHLANSLPFYEDLMLLSSQSNGKFGFKFMADFPDSYRMNGSQFGKDFTFYFADKETAEAFMPKILDLAKKHRLIGEETFEQFKAKNGISYTVNIESESVYPDSNGYITYAVRHHLGKDLLIDADAVKKYNMQPYFEGKEKRLVDGRQFYVLSDDFLRSYADKSLNEFLYRIIDEGGIYAEAPEGGLVKLRGTKPEPSDAVERITGQVQNKFDREFPNSPKDVQDAMRSALESARQELATTTKELGVSPETLLRDWEKLTSGCNSFQSLLVLQYLPLVYSNEGIASLIKTAEGAALFSNVFKSAAFGKGYIQDLSSLFVEADLLFDVMSLLEELPSSSLFNSNLKNIARISENCDIHDLHTVLSAVQQASQLPSSKIRLLEEILGREDLTGMEAAALVKLSMIAQGNINVGEYATLFKGISAHFPENSGLITQSIINAAESAPAWVQNPSLSNLKNSLLSQLDDASDYFESSSVQQILSVCFSDFKETTELERFVWAVRGHNWKFFESQYAIGRFGADGAAQLSQALQLIGKHAPLSVLSEEDVIAIITHPAEFVKLAKLSPTGFVPTANLLNGYAEGRISLEEIFARIKETSKFDPQNEFHLAIEYGKLITQISSLLPSPTLFSFSEFKNGISSSSALLPAEISKQAEVICTAYEVQQLHRELQSLSKYGNVNVIGNTRLGSLYTSAVEAINKNPNLRFYYARIGSTELHWVPYGGLKPSLITDKQLMSSIMNGEPLVVVDASGTKFLNGQPIDRMPDSFKGYRSYFAALNFISMGKELAFTDEALLEVSKLTNMDVESLKALREDLFSPGNEFFKALSPWFHNRKTKPFKIFERDVSVPGNAVIQSGPTTFSYVENGLPTPQDFEKYNCIVLYQCSYSDSTVPALVKASLGIDKWPKGALDDNEEFLKYFLQVTPKGIKLRYDFTTFNVTDAIATINEKVCETISAKIKVLSPAETGQLPRSGGKQLIILDTGYFVNLFKKGSLDELYGLLDAGDVFIPEKVIEEVKGWKDAYPELYSRLMGLLGGAQPTSGNSLRIIKYPVSASDIRLFSSSLESISQKGDTRVSEADAQCLLTAMRNLSYDNIFIVTSDKYDFVSVLNGVYQLIKDGLAPSQ